MPSDSEDENEVCDAVTPPAGAAQFLVLKTIWEDQYCQQCQVGNDKGWECLRCGRQFKPVHHTRAVDHYAKIPNQGIKVCTSDVPHMNSRGMLISGITAREGRPS